MGTVSRSFFPQITHISSLEQVKVQSLKCTFNPEGTIVILSKSMGSNHTFQKYDSTPNHTFRKYDFNSCTRYEYEGYEGVKAQPETHCGFGLLLLVGESELRRRLFLEFPNESI